MSEESIERVWSAATVRGDLAEARAQLAMGIESDEDVLLRCFVASGT